MKKKNILGLTLFLAYLGAVAYCCFGHFSDLPEISVDKFLGIPMDKIVHFLMFFPFPILCHIAFNGRGKRPGKPALVTGLVFLAGCLIAAATEIGQSFTDYRSGDVLDFAADTLSLAISSIVTLVIDLHIKKHEKRTCSKEY